MRWLFALFSLALCFNVAAKPKTQVPQLQFSVPCLEVTRTGRARILSV